MKYDRCVIEGCARSNRGQKYCRTHYGRNRDGRPMDGSVSVAPKCCKHMPCTGEAVVMGLCAVHYDAVHLAVKALRDVCKPSCAEPGCGRMSLARGLCPLHYTRTRPQPCACVECGDAKTRLRDADGDPVCRACSIELSTPARRSA